ncbi:MAG: hypothetical protein ABEJ31_04170 [Haloarculaceae archaeon]
MLAQTLLFAGVALAGGLLVHCYGTYVRVGLLEYADSRRAPIRRRIDRNTGEQTSPHRPPGEHHSLTHCNYCGAANRNGFTLCRNCLTPLEVASAPLR